MKSKGIVLSVVSLGMFGVLCSPSPASAHSDPSLLTPDSPSAPLSFWFTTATAFAQINSPTNTAAYLGPANVTISSSSGHRIELQNSHQTQNTAGSCYYRFQLIVGGGAIGGAGSVVKSFANGDSSHPVSYGIPAGQTLVYSSDGSGGNLSGSRLLNADGTDYTVDAVSEFAFSSSSTIQSVHTHTFKVN